MFDLGLVLRALGGARVEGLGCRVLGFGVLGLGFRV